MTTQDVRDTDALLWLAVHRQLLDAATLAEAEAAAAGSPLGPREWLVANDYLRPDDLADLSRSLVGLARQADLGGLFAERQRIDLALLSDRVERGELSIDRLATARALQSQLLAAGRFRRLSAFIPTGENAPTQPQSEGPIADVPHSPPGYRLEGPLGEGGIGVVYRARQLTLDRPVAIKYLRHGMLDRVASLRFRQEGHLLARLRHPGIVTVHEVGEVGGRDYLVMELVEGRSLGDWRGGRRIDPTTALPLMLGIARAVGHAHERGVIHRDLKPGNIIVGSDGQPRLLDFGLGRPMDRLDGRLTETGVSMGTPLYMAPEQVMGDLDRVDAPSDVFALGVVFYELLAGRRPFNARTRHELYQQVLQGEPEPLRRVAPTVSRDLAAIVGRAMARERGRRYASAVQLAEDLERLQDGLPVSARPPSWGYVTLRTIARHRLVATLLALLLPLAALAGTYHVRQLRGERDRARRALADKSAALTRLETEQRRRAAAEHGLARSEALRREIDEILRLEAAGAPTEQLVGRFDTAEARFARSGYLAARRGMVLLRRDRPAAALAELERADVLAPDDPDTLFYAFLAHRALGHEQTPEARQLIARLARLAPERELGLWSRGHARASAAARAETRADRERLLRESITFHERALEINRGFVWARFDRAIALAELGRYRAAVAGYTAALALDASLWQARVNRANALARLGRHAEALTDLEQAARQAPDSADLAANHGALLLQLGRPGEALERLSVAIELDDTMVEAYLNRGQLLRRLGRPKAALADFDKAVGLAPRSPQAWLARGVVRIALGQQEAGVADLARAVALDPTDAGPYLQRAHEHYHASRFAAAIADYGEALKRDDQLHSAYNGRANAHLRTGDSAAALADQQTALRLAPGRSIYWNNHGALLLQLRKPAAARRAFDRAIALDPTNAGAHLNRGTWHLRAGDDRAAHADWSRAVELDPADPRPRLERARLDQHHDRHERALRDLDQLLTGRPDWPEVRGLRGHSRLALGQHAAAEPDLLAGAAGPEPRRPERDLARLYHATGKRDAALRWCRKALARDPAWEAGKRLLAEIEEGR